MGRRQAGSTEHPSTWSLVLALSVGCLSAAGGVMIAWPLMPLPLWAWLPLHLVGICFTVVGVMAMRTRSTYRLGVLMVAVGVSWYLGDLQASTDDVVAAAGFCLYHLVAAVFAHLVLALPTGRLQGRLERTVMIVVYVTTVVTQMARSVTETNRQPQGWGDPAAPTTNWGVAGSICGFVLTVAVVVLVARRWRTAGEPMRRAYMPVWASIVVVGSVIVATILADVFAASTATRDGLLTVLAVGLIVMSFMIRAGSIRSSMARRRVADLVLALGSDPDPVHVRAAIADAVADRSLDIRFTHHGGGYIDVHGSVVDPEDDIGRSRTPVLVDGEELAVLVHGDIPPDQHELFRAVAAAVGLSLENTRLQAEARSHLRELNESRLRLIEVAANERRRIQRDLHDGAQHQLLAVSMLLDRAARSVEPSEELQAARSQLQDTLSTLRRLSHDISPPALDEHGLAEAVVEIAECSPVPMVVDVTKDRFTDAIETVSYFVIAESIANAYKHARATTIWVVASVRNGMLLIEVTDDGFGGLDVDAGTGLRSLTDRVHAVGGTLHAGARAGGGTFVRAELPVKTAELPVRTAELPCE